MLTRSKHCAAVGDRFICAIKDALYSKSLRPLVLRVAHHLKIGLTERSKSDVDNSLDTACNNLTQCIQQGNNYVQHSQTQGVYTGSSIFKCFRWNSKDTRQQKLLGLVTQSSFLLSSRYPFRHYLSTMGFSSFGYIGRVQPQRNMATSPAAVKFDRSSGDMKKQAALMRGDHIVAGYAVAEKMILPKIRKALIDIDLYNISPVITDLEDIIHVTNKYATDKNRMVKDIFFFQEGSIVFWNVSEKEIMDVLKVATIHCEEVYDAYSIMTESDSLEVQYSLKPTDLVKDTINLYEPEGGDIENPIMDKYAFSNALSQSVKLGVWERTLNSISDVCEPITKDLKLGMEIQIDNDSVMRLQGEVYGLRHKINMNSDLLDSPDFYWDRSELEDLYKKTCKYLNIAKRTKVINEKLNYCREILELAKDIQNTNSSLNIERGIAILIMVEIMFELWKFLPYLNTTEYHDSEDKDKEIGGFTD